MGPPARLRPSAHTLRTSGLSEAKRRGGELLEEAPPHPLPYSQKQRTLRGEERQRPSASGDRGGLPPATSLRLDSGTGQSPAAAPVSGGQKEPSTPERPSLGGRGTPPRGRRQLLVGRGSSPPPQRHRQGVGGVPPSPGRTPFSPSSSSCSLRSSSSSGDPDPLPSLGGSAKNRKSHGG